MKNAKSLGLKVLNLNQASIIGEDWPFHDKGIIIHSVNEDGPVALDGKIKGLNKNWIGDSILQVNEINVMRLSFSNALQIFKDIVENPKLQTVRLIVNQNVSISGYIAYGCHGNYNQYPI